MLTEFLNLASPDGLFGLKFPAPRGPDGIKLGLGYRVASLGAAAMLVFGICVAWGALNGWRVTNEMLIVIGVSFILFVGISEQFRFRIFEGGRRRRMFSDIHADEGVVLLDRTRIGAAQAAVARPGQAPPRRGFYLASGKRVLDLSLASLALLLSLPLLAALALLVKTQRKGRILERVEAYAPDGREISFVRFNTSHPDDLDRKVHQYWRRDTERTPVNDFLIRSGLDRLPALVAVVRGDLALVGPDARSFRVDKAEIPPLRAGLTGFQRLTGKAYGYGIEGRVDDLYVKYASLRLDLRIILKSLRRTIAAAL